MSYKKEFWLWIKCARVCSRGYALFNIHVHVLHRLSVHVFNSLALGITPCGLYISHVQLHVYLN